MEKEKQELKEWEKVGKIAARIMDYAKKIAKKEMPLIELAEAIEKKVSKLAVKSAFPVNLSIDAVAAHYSPCSEDNLLARGLLKIDLGINNNGFISDMACSLDLTEKGEYTDLIKASEYALKEALKVIEPGISVCEIGEVIHDVISTFDAKPIFNLTGHELKRWILHAGLTIPNYNDGDMTKIEEGMVLAIEPFATYGEGFVKNGEQSCIYVMKKAEKADYNVHSKNARILLEFIKEKYKSLPFSSRWLVKKFGKNVLLTLKMLEEKGILHNFKQLIEKSGGVVSQAEHTILVTKDGCKILTIDEE